MQTIDGKRIYTELYTNYENRPTIIFLHDSLGCSQLWRDFPSKLAEAANCNFFLYDRIGYGKSEAMETYIRPTNYLELEADFLDKLISELNLENIILFGHSDGASIALLTAAKYPDRIKGLIVEAAHIFVEDITLKGIRDFKEIYQTTNISERLAKYHGEKVELIVNAWTETWLREDYRNWNIEKFLPKITAPLLFIQGEKDEYGTIEQVMKTIKQVSGKAEKFVLPNAGHTPHKENQEAVLVQSSEFILSSL